MARLFLLIFLFSLNAYSQNCTEHFNNSSPTSTLDKTIFGKIKCNSLDRNTWEEGWKTPCDCLYQQDIGSKIRRRAYKKSEQRKLSSIDQRVEKKIADVFKTQIFTELEQALRLDIYLKKGVISTKNIGNGKDLSVPFPESCRIDKIGDLIRGLDQVQCKNPRKEDRLKLLFGEEGFGKWKDSQMKLFENTVMNKLSDEDRKNGMCVPYKTFLSFNSANNLRTTYLKVAKAKKLSFKDFQMWASDRRNPDDTSRIIASDEVREEVPSSMSGSALKLLQPGYGSSWMKKQTGALRLKLDDKSQVEPISNEDIQRLIKTDPIFERMIRDPQFFEAMTAKDIESFNPNDPSIIKIISESQNRQCKNLYDSPSGNNEDTEARSRKKDGKNKPKEENSLLMRYLCEENFPRDFIDEGVITSTLAPEFNKELGLDDEQKATDYLVDYLYCQSKETKDRNIPKTNGEISADFTSTFMGIPKNDDIKNLLNLSLNPKSDLEQAEVNGDKKASGKNQTNEYQKFNVATCKHIDEKCKQVSGDEGNASVCSLSTLSRDIVEQILKERFPENELATIEKQIFDISLSDKEVRAILTEKGFFTKDQADSVITLRHQDQKFQWKEVAEDLKKETANRATGQIPPDGVDPVTYIFSHRHEIKADPNISDELKTRILEIGKLRSKNSIVSETTNDENSSYFANYFVLAGDDDEKKVVKINNDSSSSSTPRGGSYSSNNSPSGTTLTGGNGGGPGTTMGQVQSPQGNSGDIITQGPETVYQRKTFGTTPPPSKQDDSKGIVANTDPIKSEPPTASIDKPAANKDTEATKKDRGNAISENNNTRTNFPGLTLTQTSNGRDNSGPGGGRGDDTSEYEKQKKELEDRIKRTNDEIKKLKNQEADGGNSENPELSDLKKRLKDLIDEKKRGGGGSTVGSRRIGNNDNGMGNNNSFGSGWNNNGYFGGNNDYGGSGNQFNDGYGRGREFINEQAKNQLDDPENTNKNSEGGGGAGGSGSGGKGKTGAGGSGGNAILSTSGDSGDDGGDGSGNGSGRGKRKRKRGSGGPDDQELVAKCGTGPILKCVFPNSYFLDIDEIKGRLYTTMANLRLEGRKFQALEMVKKSKRDMRMGESSKGKYFLITYDVVIEKRQVTDEERKELYNEIKENRKDPKFKKKLIKYRFMTKAVPPKLLLNEKEKNEILNRTITPDEYLKLHTTND